MQSLIAERQRAGRVCSARNYTTVLHRFRDFLGGRDLTFADLDATLIARFETWLQTTCGLRRNTTSSYLRILRTVCRAAAEAGHAVPHPLFAHVYMGIDTTVKRALTLSDLQALCALDLTAQPWLAHARDLFLLSFYLRGMPFIDMAYLRRSDCHDGLVIYCRRKTHRPVTVRWEPEMQALAARYAALTVRTPYLLPILLRADGTERRQYERAMCRQNRRLKTLGRMAGLTVPLTQYAARHTWASLAYAAHVPLSVISRGMGHSCERVTLTYLKTLDTADVDRANRMLIGLLGGTGGGVHGV